MAKKDEPMHGMEELGQEPKRIPREAPGGEPLHSMTEIGGVDSSPATEALNNPAMFQKESSGVGTQGVIGSQEVTEAFAILEKYKAGKANLENKIIENEKWWKLRHWDVVNDNPSEADTNQPEPVSAWLHNTVTNIHADIMDNYPSPTVKPRQQQDMSAATTLTEIMPVMMNQAEFPLTYSLVSYYKLKFGTGVYSVTWDSQKNNGLGDIALTKCDLLNLYWQPGVVDIQKSRNFFSVECMDRDEVAEQYTFLDKERIANQTEYVAKYVHDESIDDSNQCLIVDWYYKRIVNGKKILHFCKFVGDQVIYASENDPEYAEKGYYDHGLYPFFFDVLYPEEDMPVGFGYIDICKSPQIYLDKLDQCFLKNAVIGSRPRFFVKNDGNINENEYADIKKDFVHFTGSGDPNESIMPITAPELKSIYVELRQLKIDEMKETSGNRDVSQGGTTSGITAASAIAALQEAGSKRSRDIIENSYFVMNQIYKCVIELKRQFDKYPTSYRVDGANGETQFREFSGQDIAMQQQPMMPGETEPMFRKPEFDVEVVAQKASAFSTAAANERAKELFQLGFFNPQLADQSMACLEMMSFDGIDAVKEKVSKNGLMFDKLQQMSQLALLMAQQIASLGGVDYTQQIAQIVQGGQPGQTEQPTSTMNESTMRHQGEAMRKDNPDQEESSVTANARAKTAEAATPR